MHGYAASNFKIALNIVLVSGRNKTMFDIKSLNETVELA